MTEEYLRIFGGKKEKILRKQQLGFPWAPQETHAAVEQSTGPETPCVGCGKPGRPSSLHHLIHALRPKLAAEAQKHYDDWAQDEDGVDEEYGEGGICDHISDGLSSVLHQHIGNINITDGGADGDDHAFPVVYDRDHAFAVDIPPYVYETGGGYRWKKNPDVTIRPEDVEIEPLNRSWFNGDGDSPDGPARGHVCANCAPRVLRSYSDDDISP